MTKTIHILTRPLEDQNVRAFWAPLLANKQLLSESGFIIRPFETATPALVDCDTLILTSSFWRGPWTERREEAIPFIEKCVNDSKQLLYFDRASTSGTVNADVLPLVHRYYKTNLLKDRSLYQQELYGLRQFTDYYHRNYGVLDPIPALSSPVRYSSDLGKLRPSWNTALANYSLLGPRLSTLYRKLPLTWLMKPTTRFNAPSVDRSIDVSCRMGTTYKYETVAYQRRQIADRLARFRRADRISKIAYFRELRDSKIVTSPFGFSEVNYKDFETFLSGAILLKPDMSHIETYPDFYRDGETFISHKWDFSDLDEKVEEVLDNYSVWLHVAEAGQDLYRQYTVGPQAAERFVSHFVDLLAEAETSPHT
jgi:hypothetical protein